MALCVTELAASTASMSQYEFNCTSEHTNSPKLGYSKTIYSRHFSVSHFYARRLSVERNSYSGVAGWVGGWLSVTAGTVSKRLNVSENFIDHLMAPP